MTKAFLLGVGAVLAAGTMPAAPATAQYACNAAIRSCQQHFFAGRYPQYSTYEECVERESELRCPPSGPGQSRTAAADTLLIAAGHKRQG